MPEPTQNVDEEEMKPARVAIFFTGADSDDLPDIVGALVKLAEDSGLFYEWATINNMDVDQVIPGSPLHQLLTGEEPDDGEDRD